MNQNDLKEQELHPQLIQTVDRSEGLLMSEDQQFSSCLAKDISPQYRGGFERQPGIETNQFSLTPGEETNSKHKTCSVQQPKVPLLCSPAFH